MNRVRRVRGRRGQVLIGESDPDLTPAAGMVAVTELVDRLGIVAALDAAIGPIKQRSRGLSGGEFLLGLACAQLAGEDFMIGLDRRRADVAGARLAPVPLAASTTAATLAKRFDPSRWQAVEAAIGQVTGRMVSRLGQARRRQLSAAPTLDLDATDVEVYGRRKRGVAYNYKGQRAGRPHLASWAEAGVVLAADLLAGDQDPRAGVVDLFSRALRALDAAAPGHGRIRVRGDIGYFTKDLAEAILAAEGDFAIGATRNPATWRAAATVPEDAWTDADGMPGAQVAVADYVPGGWPAAPPSQWPAAAGQALSCPSSVGFLRAAIGVPPRLGALARSGAVTIRFGYHRSRDHARATRQESWEMANRLANATSPYPAAAQGQPRRLAGVGTRRLRGGATARRAGAAQRRVRRLPLVPRARGPAARCGSSVNAGSQA